MLGMKKKWNSKQKIGKWPNRKRNSTLMWKKIRSGTKPTC